MSDTTTKKHTIRDQDTRDRVGPWRENTLAPLDTFKPGTNFVIRAAAGSGKTTALVGRMLALVRTGTPVETIAAITFTKKAAGEMQARFYEELMQAKSHAEPGSEEAQHIQQALDQLPNCFIGTIHSFCQELLRTQPEAAGVAKGFTTLDEDRDKEELRDRFWQEYLQESWTERRDQVDGLTDIGVEVSELTSFFGTLADKPNLSLFTDGASEPPNLDDAIEEVLAFYEKWKPYAPEESSTCGTAQAFEEAERYLTVRGLSSRASQAEFLDIFSGLTEKDRRNTETDIRGKIKPTKWGEHKPIAEKLDDELLVPFVTELVEPALRKWNAFVHRKAVEFVRPAVKAYRQHRWANGQLTFSDLLLAARNLLRDNPDVRERFQQKYRHVLVDEFQDTDPLQAEVLFYLTGRNTEERDWRRCEPRPGSLFIVGDDKQSIYGFRQADMAVFNEVADLIAAQDCGETAPLFTNFRSAKRICNWCDDAFEHIFEGDRAQAPNSQAEYVAFDAQRKVPAGWSPVQQLTVSKVDGNEPKGIAEQNANQIAQYIQRAVEQDEPLLTGESGNVLIDGMPGDFMILTRNTKRLSIYAEALAERGIPYTVAGGKDARMSEELQGLVDALACVLRPDDPVARVAYLRGPLVGFSDDALYRIKQAYRAAGMSREAFGDDAFEVPDAVASELDLELTERLREAYMLLAQARETLATERPAAAIHSIAEQAGLFARALHHEGEASLRAGRLYRILDEVRHLDSQGLHWSEILQELDDILHGERELDGMTLETGQRDSVRLLNVHKAKGLQANVVFLADPYDRYYDPSPTAYVQQSENGKKLVQPVCDYNANIKYAPSGWDQRFEAQAEQDDAAEEHRLQYVAATRAKRLLVVSRYEEKEEDGFWADLYPFLDRTDAPELTVPAEATETTPEAAPTSWQPDLSAAASRRERAIAAGSQPRYREERVTDGVEAASLTIEDDGYGADFGSAVHELLEIVNDAQDDAVAKDPDVIRRMLQHHMGSASDEEVRRVRHIIDAWTSSSLWNPLCGASKVHTEIPIAAYTSGEGAVLQRGVIDLVFQHVEGWVIIDFKTNRLDGDDALEEHLSHYGPQLRAYAAAWAKQTGIRLGRVGLWFTDSGGTFATIDHTDIPW